MRSNLLSPRSTSPPPCCPDINARQTTTELEVEITQKPIESESKGRFAPFFEDPDEVNPGKLEKPSRQGHFWGGLRRPDLYDFKGDPGGPPG